MTVQMNLRREYHNAIMIVSMLKSTWPLHVGANLAWTDLSRICLSDPFVNKYLYSNYVPSCHKTVHWGAPSTCKGCSKNPYLPGYRATFLRNPLLISFVQC